MLFATAAYNFSTSERQKVLRDRQFFSIFTSKCAFRHSGVQFFDISTYKSALGMRCFVHFHFRMCFSPQRRAIFRHLNFKKCSETVCFLTFFRHSSVEFFSISTYKSGPNTSCFLHVHSKMCFSPQRRAIFDLSADHLTPHPPL